MTQSDMESINLLNLDMKKIRKKLADQGDPDVDWKLDLW